MTVKIFVADRLGLDGIGIELSQKYIEMIHSRLANEGEPMLEED